MPTGFRLPALLIRSRPQKILAAGKRHFIRYAVNEIYFLPVEDAVAWVFAQACAPHGTEDIEGGWREATKKVASLMTVSYRRGSVFVR